MKKIIYLAAFLMMICTITVAQKVSNYPSATSLAAGDLFDLTKKTGASSYASQKLDYTLFLTELNTDLTNFYTGDGTFGANRTVTMGGFTVNLQVVILELVLLLIIHFRY